MSIRTLSQFKDQVTSLSGINKCLKDLADDKVKIGRFGRFKVTVNVAKKNQASKEITISRNELARYATTLALKMDDPEKAREQLERFKRRMERIDEKVNEKFEGSGSKRVRAGRRIANFSKRFFDREVKIEKAMQELNKKILEKYEIDQADLSEHLQMENARKGASGDTIVTFSINRENSDPLIFDLSRYELAKYAASLAKKMEKQVEAFKFLKAFIEVMNQIDDQIHEQGFSTDSEHIKYLMKTHNKLWGKSVDDFVDRAYKSMTKDEFKQFASDIEDLMYLTLVERGKLSADST